MTRATVIDPDNDVLDLYRELLSAFGYEVETYSDSLPGIEELVASRPDVVIVDVELDPHREQLTGLQVVHSARSSSALRDVPFILTTTATERIAAFLSDTMQRGGIHRLEKPFDLETFERVMRTALGLDQGATDAPDSAMLRAQRDRKRGD